MDIVFIIFWKGFLRIPMRRQPYFQFDSKGLYSGALNIGPKYHFKQQFNIKTLNFGIRTYLYYVKAFENFLRRIFSLSLPI